MKAAEEQRQWEKDEEKRRVAEQRKEEKRQEREVRCVSYLMNIHKHESEYRRTSEEQSVARLYPHWHIAE